MLSELKWMSLSEDIEYEIRQALEEEKDLSEVQTQIEAIRALEITDPKREVVSRELFELLLKIPSKTDAIEPSELDQIKRLRPERNSRTPQKLNISREELYDKLYGAWLGRCAGCLLGTTVEGWPKQKIADFMQDTNQTPLSYYLSSDVSEELIEKYKIVPQFHGYINNVTNMPIDDDTNYTVLALKLLKQAGYDFNGAKVGEHWLYNLPLLSCCTAERVAYINLCNGSIPPKTAMRYNPYREWIGAMIRGDLYGYVTPLDPEKGAEMAFYDASISHIKNGIYGEMFIAAMLSTAYGITSMTEIIEGGLAQIPADSRFTKQMRLILKWYREGISAAEAVRRVHELYDENDGYDWCHVISNAMVVCTALLYGESDYERTICLAVEAGFDTDCNGATVGSVVGLLLGGRRLPQKWILPLNDTMQSAVQGYTLCKISELARETAEITAKRYLSEAD